MFEGGPTWQADLCETKKQSRVQRKDFPCTKHGDFDKTIYMTKCTYGTYNKLIVLVMVVPGATNPSNSANQPSRALLIQFSTYHSSTNHPSIWKFPEQIVNSLSSVESISPILSLYNKCTNVPNQ